MNINEVVNRYEPKKENLALIFYDIQGSNGTQSNYEETLKKLGEIGH